MAAFSLAGRTALVTGASRGLGFAMARALGDAGAAVWLNARDPQALAAKCAELQQAGISASPLPFDVTDEAAVVAGINRLVGQRQRLDILIANAGIISRKPVLEHSTAEFAQVIQTDLTACFVLAREAARHMLKQKHGRIINTSSVMGRIARPNVPAYAAAKAGLESLTRQLAVEFAPHGITANAIAPGFISTELTEVLKSNSEFYDWSRRRTPAGRWGEPREVAAAAVFLASDEASYVTGHTLVVDGGMTVAM
jgi:gluconate 5-dehydrogenase